jgi:hypothetical protein
MASSGVGGIGSSTSLTQLQALTAFNLTRLTKQGTFSAQNNPFGPAFSIDFTNTTKPIAIPSASTQTNIVAGDTLRDSAGNFVAIAPAVDHNGDQLVTTALTITMETSSGKLIGFQTAPPSGLNLGYSPAAGETTPATPTLSDGSGGSVTPTVLYDQFGGSVLQISLTDAKGNPVTFYSQEDSNGFVLNASTPTNLPTAFSFLPGANAVSTSSFPTAITPFTSPPASLGIMSELAFNFFSGANANPSSFLSLFDPGSRLSFLI